jgi:hypothetical protein
MGLVLQMPDFNKIFTVDSNSSGARFGTVLYQAPSPSPSSAGPS